MITAPDKKAVFTEEVIQDPYPTYARMHEEGPLHYVDVGNKWAVWSIFSHAECSVDRKRPEAFRKTREANVIAPSA